MKKVGAVLDNITELDKQYKIISDMVNKIHSDDEVAKYMFEKFKVDKKVMQDISNTLLNRKYDLEGQLRESEVDVR